MTIDHDKSAKAENAVRAYQDGIISWEGLLESLQQIKEIEK